MNNMEIITLITILGSALVLLASRETGSDGPPIPRAPRVPQEFATGEWEEVP